MWSGFANYSISIVAGFVCAYALTRRYRKQIKELEKLKKTMVEGFLEEIDKARENGYYFGMEDQMRNHPEKVQAAYHELYGDSYEPPNYTL
jgi:hypothetical protein